MCGMLKLAAVIVLTSTRRISLLGLCLGLCVLAAAACSDPPKTPAATPDTTRSLDVAFGLSDVSDSSTSSPQDAVVGGDAANDAAGGPDAGSDGSGKACDNHNACVAVDTTKPYCHPGDHVCVACLNDEHCFSGT